MLPHMAGKQMSIFTTRMKIFSTLIGIFITVVDQQKQKYWSHGVCMNIQLDATGSPYSVQ